MAPVCPLDSCMCIVPADERRCEPYLAMINVYKNSWIQIRIRTPQKKITSSLYCENFIKIHLLTFWITVLTDRISDKPTLAKHNLLGGGNRRQSNLIKRPHHRVYKFWKRWWTEAGLRRPSRLGRSMYLRLHRPRGRVLHLHMQAAAMLCITRWSNNNTVVLKVKLQTNQS